MGYKFNPFTGTLDNVGSGSGGGGTVSVTDGTTTVTASTIKFVGGTVTNAGAGEADVSLTGGATTVVIGEIPSGTIDDSNITFTLAHSPAGSKVSLFINRLRMNPGAGADYTISTTTITLTNPVGTGGSIAADYQF